MKNAIIAAIVAAFVASGTTYAASGLINGRRIANHSIAASKLTPAAVRSLHGQRGPAGVAGPQGQAGGPFDPGFVQIAIGPSVILAPGDVVDTSATCPLGLVAISGGAIVGTNFEPGQIVSSLPFALGVGYPNQWDAKVSNPSTTWTMTARAEAVCVS